MINFFASLVGVFLFAVASAQSVVSSESSTQGPDSWEPEGWVYYTWPYAYSFTEERWFYFNQADTQWLVNLSTSLWTDMEEWSGWHYYRWPYAYSWDQADWYWYNHDLQRVADLSTGTWLLFGAAVIEPKFPVPEDEDKFTLIPAGSFSMGDAFSEGGSGASPVHSVTLAGFYMGTHEVRYRLWEEVRDWAVANGYSDLSGVGLGKGNDHPVHSVNWYDVVKWCNAASERAGLEPVYRVSDGGEVYRSGELAPYIDYSNQGYRLPTEAEWEKAARGGAIGRRFPWGSRFRTAMRITGPIAVYMITDTSPSGSDIFYPDYAVGGFSYTSPVGSFGGNAYGLHDMAGNVWEWCNDWYAYSYYTTSPAYRSCGSGFRLGSRFTGWQLEFLFVLLPSCLSRQC